MTTPEREPVMISALEHWSYCPRQCALIHVEQAFEQNVHTMRGNAVHERVDEPGWDCAPGARVERALPVFSDRLGLIGKCDVVEFRADGEIYPVEYKHGPRRAQRHDALQLAAQAMCLEEMTGRPVARGAVFHHSSRRRREVEITSELRGRVETAVEAVRAIIEPGTLPPPVSDRRCEQCSLRELCQPEALAAVGRRRALLANLFEPDAA